MVPVAKVLKEPHLVLNKYRKFRPSPITHVEDGGEYAIFHYQNGSREMIPKEVEIEVE